jgi:hypothetical protein
MADAHFDGEDLGDDGDIDFFDGYRSASDGDDGANEFAFCEAAEDILGVLGDYNIQCADRIDMVVSLLHDYSEILSDDDIRQVFSAYHSWCQTDDVSTDIGYRNTLYYIFDLFQKDPSSFRIIYDTIIEAAAAHLAAREAARAEAEAARAAAEAAEMARTNYRKDRNSHARERKAALKGGFAAAAVACSSASVDSGVDRNGGGGAVLSQHNKAAATSSRSGPSGVRQAALTTSDLVPFNNEVTMGGEYDGHLKCGGGKSGATKTVTGSAPKASKTATPSSGSIDGV